jgi:hypothetical protein
MRFAWLVFYVVPARCRPFFARRTLAPIDHPFAQNAQAEQHDSESSVYWLPDTLSRRELPVNQVGARSLTPPSLRCAASRPPNEHATGETAHRRGRVVFEGRMVGMARRGTYDIPLVRRQTPRASIRDSTLAVIRTGRSVRHHCRDRGSARCRHGVGAAFTKPN